MPFPWGSHVYRMPPTPEEKAAAQARREARWDSKTEIGRQNLALLQRLGRLDATAKFRNVFQDGGGI